MEPSKEMEELLKRIYMPSVFYFPIELFPDLSTETKKELDKYQFFEELGILKANGEVEPLKRAANTLEIGKKDGVLEANVFQLLETKERLKRESFVFLLDRYLSYVKTWIYAYNWLLSNFDKQFTETDKKLKSLFEYQCVVLDNHLKILNQKFQFNYSNTPTTNLVDILSKNKEMLPLGQSLNNDLKGSVKKVEVKADQKSVKQNKKKLLLTEKQADDFLLKTVFNVQEG